MATEPFYTTISSEIENDKSELLKKAKEVCHSSRYDIQRWYQKLQLEPELQESEVKIDDVWTPHTARLIKGHPAKRLIVFRPWDSQKLLGCIRVYKSGTTVKLWDVYDREGTFIGKIPKNCPFEAMLVEVKFITWTESPSWI